MLGYPFIVNSFWYYHNLSRDKSSCHVYVRRSQCNIHCNIHFVTLRMFYRCSRRFLSLKTSPTSQMVFLLLRLEKRNEVHFERKLTLHSQFELIIQYSDRYRLDFFFDDEYRWRTRPLPMFLWLQGRTRSGSFCWNDGTVSVPGTIWM